MIKALAVSSMRLARHHTLIFHRVLNEQDPMSPDEPTADWFRILVKWLAGSFEVISLDEAVTRAVNHRQHGPTVSITFDDGYADNFLVALPILEENKVEYVSNHPGVMHACGHDAHTSMLLGIASLLMERRDQFSGTVKLLFQPGEEGPGGAEPMIEQGVLENPHVDGVFGMHVAQGLPVGQIAYKPGPAMASADGATIIIQGKGGHGASPHLSVDPIVIASHIVLALQTIVGRNINPVDTAVVTVGMIGAGEANNVIPDTAEMKLTVRTFLPATRAMVKERIHSIAKNVAEAFGATAEVTYNEGYPSVINDVACTALVEEVATEVVGRDNAIMQGARMGGEDFSYFLQERPGSFFYVGVQNVDRGIVWGHHHPRFDLDEEGLGYGIEVMTRVAMRYLNEGV